MSCSLSLSLSLVCSLSLSLLALFIFTYELIIENLYAITMPSTSSRFFSDIEEKYTKKLEKMGTTGRGPTVEFAEKRDYKPEVRIGIGVTIGSSQLRFCLPQSVSSVDCFPFQINIMYVDKKGREMEPKDAFRELSWK